MGRSLSSADRFDLIKPDKLSFPISINTKYRDEVQITIEYVITTEPMRDHSKPWTDVEYNDSDEGCRYGPDDRERCQNEWWRAKFRVQDEDTGLHLITVTNTGKQNYQNNVYYW